MSNRDFIIAKLSKWARESGEDFNSTMWKMKSGTKYMAHEFKMHGTWLRENFTPNLATLEKMQPLELPVDFRQWVSEQDTEFLSNTCDQEWYQDIKDNLLNPSEEVDWKNINWRLTALTYMRDEADKRKEEEKRRWQTLMKEVQEYGKEE